MTGRRWARALQLAWFVLPPCATAEGPFALGRHNGYWQLPNLEFVRDLDPQLRSYLAYQLEPSSRLDTLRAFVRFFGARE